MPDQPEPFIYRLRDEERNFTFEVVCRNRLSDKQVDQIYATWLSNQKRGAPRDKTVRVSLSR